MLSHYAALFSDTVFFVLTLPYLVAAWLILHQWRTLFAVMSSGIGTIELALGLRF